MTKKHLSFFKVREDRILYTKEPDDSRGFTEMMDREYSRYARIYDVVVKILPVWKTWIKKALPHIKGERVLEVSFGTGYLLTRYAGKHETHGIDYNEVMVKTASDNLARKKLTADLKQGDVESLPYPDEYFDTIVNTMAFSGYPRGDAAMSEFRRVLKKGGRLVIVDFEYPSNRNRAGYALVKLMENAGDIIRDLASLLKAHGFAVTEIEVGGFGSVHLYVAHKE